MAGAGACPPGRENSVAAGQGLGKGKSERWETKGPGKNDVEGPLEVAITHADLCASQQGHQGRFRTEGAPTKQVDRRN